MGWPSTSASATSACARSALHPNHLVYVCFLILTGAGLRLQGFGPHGCRGSAPWAAAPRNVCRRRCRRKCNTIPPPQNATPPAAVLSSLQFEEVLSYARIPPVVNQVELHPLLAQRKLVGVCLRKVGAGRSARRQPTSSCRSLGRACLHGACWHSARWWVSACSRWVHAGGCLPAQGECTPRASRALPAAISCWSLGHAAACLPASCLNVTGWLVPGLCDGCMSQAG